MLNTRSRANNGLRRLVRHCVPDCLFAAATLFICFPAMGQTATPAASPAQNSISSTPPGAPSSEPASPTVPKQGQTEHPASEITTRDDAATFKVNVNLVPVRVVVRDASGHAVGNLQKDDFLLFDDHKPQVITQFSAEQAGKQVPKPTEANAGQPGTATESVIVPQSFIAYLFDDVHLAFGDLVQAREAAERHMRSLRPTDRAAVFTTSGRTALDFTDDRAKLHQALFQLQPHPIARTGATGCFNVSYYMADLIENQHDPQALSVAAQDALACEFGNDARMLSAAQQLADSTAREVLISGEQESHVTLTVVSDIIRRLSVAIGQRSIVLVSPGFLTPELEFEYTSVIDRAVKAQVVIGALDARGLYVDSGFDVSSQAPSNARSLGMRQQYAASEASANSNILVVLSDATGGVFFHNNNDLDEGFRRVASTPEYSYVLGFSPANLKLDGRFHVLKVSLKNPQKFSIQARRGYHAPKRAQDPAQLAKEEIEDALFSQEEMHSLPVELHTQFYKANEADARLTVLAHIDVRRLRLRKADGRNQNELTLVSALFNGNGTLVQAIQKTLTMKLRDETLEKKMGSGITLRTSFDVKPGNYLVRLVVRDAEAQVLSAENDAVRIP
jgi:VWFA-related protein